ncbi:hypothetical protein GCM10007870_23170 [Gluconobacter kondonii]|uniref:Uncharacterized protein n=1 Tax=Gluconobacter kondonii TaxID=941463 RepID=A0ABQ5WT55_9PROT|nr:hypothetical protein GCM10007870_23170 [Gluconobacter kondonii]
MRAAMLIGGDICRKLWKRNAIVAVAGWDGPEGRSRAVESENGCIGGGFPLLRASHRHPWRSVLTKFNTQERNSG